MKKCFIVCPIGHENSETRKRSDTLLNFILKPLCEECGFHVMRVDESNTGDSITKNIIEHLTQDDLVIADLSEQNPNAFYELGYRTALGKPTIQIKAKDEPLPFDVSSIQTFDYNINDIPDTEKFKERIKKTIESFNFNSTQDVVTKDTTQNFNASILQELYRIQDMLSGIDNKLQSTDTTTVSILADKIAQMGNKSPEAVLIESVISGVTKNPEAFLKIAEFSNPSKK